MEINTVRKSRVLLTTTNNEINRLMSDIYKIEIGMDKIVLYSMGVDTFCTRTLIKEKIRATLEYIGSNMNDIENYDYTIRLNDVVQVHEERQESYTKIIFDIV